MDDTSIINKNALGFHRPGSFEKIVDIQYCYLQADPSNEIRNFIRTYAITHHLTFYNVKSHAGLLRNLVIRTALDGSTMVTMVYGEDQPEVISEINTAIVDRFPDITLYTIVNLKFNDTTFDLEPILIHGRGYLLESLGHLTCRVGPKSFFQTNSTQAKRLYEFIEEFADLKGSELIYDLYSGTGTIGLFLAHKASKIIGVEEISEAVQDAILNAKENDIDNAVFYAGDVKKLLQEGLFEKEGSPDLIILDPPRSGLHPDNIPILLAAGAPRIIYVSCNPSTQARDLKLLSTGYQHMVSQPVDMFPHTGHIENVTLLHQRIM
jgi:23S rRNA (uracil1939-C5)-methyltransferase